MKAERTVAENHKAAMAEIDSNKSRITALEEAVNAFKKQLALLDDKMRGMGKAAAMSGNPGMAGNLFDDLEKAIADLRKDLNDHKIQNGREHDQIREQLAEKASKDDLAELVRLLQHLEDRINNQGQLIPDKANLKRQLNGIEKEVSGPAARRM